MNTALILTEPWQTETNTDRERHRQSKTECQRHTLRDAQRERNFSERFSTESFLGESLSGESFREHERAVVQVRGTHATPQKQ